MRSAITKEIVLEKYRVGITSPSQLSRELGVERTTIWRKLNELKAGGLLEELPAPEYQRFSLTKNWVEAIPSVKVWSDHMAFRGVRSRRDVLSCLKRFCDKLSITPDQLTPDSFRQLIIDRGMEWWKGVGEPTKYGYRKAVRGYLMSRGFSIPRGMGKSLGLSGEKGDISKYSHIKLSDDEIEQISKKIDQKVYRTLWRIGILTCSRPGELINFKPAATSVRDGIATVEFFDTKNQKKRIKRVPVDLLESYAEFYGKGFRIPAEPNELRDVFRKAYRDVGLTDSYFYDHPLHTLRHVGAHYWLRRTNYSHSIVAKIGGWDSSEILRQVYGDIPETIIETVVRSGLN